MADGCHLENRLSATPRRHIVGLTRNLNGWSRIARTHRSREQNCTCPKFKMADGCHFGKKVSYRKQIACQHSCHQKICPGQGDDQLVKIPSSCLNPMQNLVPGCALVGGPKIFGTRCCHRGWPCRNTPLSACVALPNVVVVGQTARMQLHWTARKIELLHSTFEVTQSRSANYDFLLVIHNNHDNFFYRFREKNGNMQIIPCLYI